MDLEPCAGLHRGGSRHHVVWLGGTGRPLTAIREYECIENNEDLLRIEKLLQDESVFRRPPKQ